MEKQNEKIVINEKILEYGVLSDEKGLCLYVYPGMSVAQIAFDVMATIRILEQSEYIPNAKTFLDLIDKYLNDTQYEPLNDGDISNTEDEEITNNAKN